MSRAATLSDEAFHMSETSSFLNLANPSHPVNRTLTVIKFGVLIVSIAAAIPTARNLYFSWKNGVPFNQVEHRLNQAALLEKNFDCKIDYRTLMTSSNARVEVGSCAKTGDISIRVTGRNGQVNYEWIAFDQLPKPAASRSVSLMDFIAPRALAGDELLSRVDAPFDVAQETSVLCQSKVGDNIVRVVQSGGQCVRETVSIFRGSVEKSEPVPCNSACPIVR